MKKISTKKNISEMKKFINRMPKNINEAIDYEGGDDEMMYDDYDEEEQHGMPQQQPQAQANDGVPTSKMDVAGFIDDIRKKSLKAMAQLADYPESPEYEQLKKIWQLCDKKPDQKVQGQAYQNAQQQQQQDF